MRKSVASYGSWRSPITADMAAAHTKRLGQVVIDGDDIYWCELRPTEAGRTVIVKRFPDGHTIDVTPPPFNARTRVHEYGGGAYTVHRGTVYFTHFPDQRLYIVKPNEPPEPITPAEDRRYADLAVDTRRLPRL